MTRNLIEMSMRGEKVEVKWDAIWYPATILRINDNEAEVEFEDPDYPVEIVPLCDIRGITSISESSCTKPIAGAFNWHLFKEFCEDILENKVNVTILSVEENAELDLKSSLFSPHATERIEERYRDNMQELFRSIISKQYLAFRETRRKLYGSSVQLNCTPDLKTIISVENGTPRPISNLTSADTENLKLALNEWNRTHFEKLAIDLQSCYVSGDIVRVGVITTTSRFVLNKNGTCMVTAICLKEGFRQWQRRVRRQKAKAISKHRK